jgi:uncharacterized protein YutE (UPF0331/DUF86 family)
MDQIMVSQLRMLNQYIDVLSNIKNHNKEEYLNDDILRGAAERYLQLAIETCLNLGNRILSLEQFSAKFKAPETYAEIFEKLAEIKVLDPGFAARLKDMAKFRNKLVHIYWEIDAAFVYELLQTELPDFRSFITAISNYIKNH